MTTASSPSIPSGPFDAVRLGWRIYRAGRSTLTSQVIALFVVMVALGFGGLALAGQPLGKAPGMLTMSAAQVFLYVAVGLPVIVLQIGLMHSIGEVIQGRAVQLRDLAWGLPHKRVWLLAIIIQALAFVTTYTLSHTMRLAGMQPTGNPQHPYTMAHASGPAALLGLLTLSVSLILNNLVLTAMACEARGLVSPLTAARSAFLAFRRGYRRFLWVNVAWMLVIMGAALAAALGMVLVILVLHLALPKPAFAIAALITGAAALIVLLIAALGVMIAMPASYVVTAEALDAA